MKWVTMRRIGSLCFVAIFCVLEQSIVDGDCSQNSEQINSDPSIDFGDFVKFNYNNQSDPVHGIKADLLNPGGFLVARQSGIEALSAQGELTMLTLAAVGSEPTDMVQINNGSDLVMVINSKCVRKLDRNSGLITTIAGKCNGTTSEYIISNGSAVNASFNSLRKVLYVYARSELYYLSLGSRSGIAVISVHNLVGGNITQFSEPKSLHATSMVLDSTSTNLYITQRYGILKYNTATKLSSIVAGSTIGKDESFTHEGSRDGILQDARFGDETRRSLGGIVWLIPDKVLLVTHKYDDSLRVINLVTKNVSTVLQSCEHQKQETNYLNRLSSVSIIDSVIYICSSHGDIWTLNYTDETLFCTPPHSSDQNLIILKTKDVYGYGEEIRFECNGNMGLNTTYSAVRCEEYSEDYGTTYEGGWNNPIPKCKDAKIIKPVDGSGRGQANGGADIVLEGYFPPKVTLAIHFFHGGHEDEFNHTRIDNKKIEFTIPPAEPNETASIHILSESGDTLGWYTYEYLPNPVVGTISRNSTFVSGGLTIVFSGANLQSAVRYNLGISYGKHNWSQICSPVESAVRCPSPNFQTRRIWTLAGKRIKASMTLFSNGFPVIGAAALPLTLIDQEVEKLFTTTKKMDYKLSEGENELSLDIENNDTGLFRADFTVTIENLPLVINITCEVTELTDTRINLSFDAKSSILINSVRGKSVEMTVMVKLAGKRVAVSNLTMYRNIDEHEPDVKPTVDNPPQTPILNYALPIVVITISILIASTIGVVYWWHRRNQNLDPPSATNELPPYMDHVGVRDKLIDPQKLHYDPKSRAIGEGHIGKVFQGQLNTTGNVLKTVAVKTFKEADDINMVQLEEFLDEASFMKGYKHANILTTIGIAWCLGDRPKVVLPYMENGDLCSLIRRPDVEFTKGDMVHFGKQITSGLCFMADKRLLHRDIAARNCLVSGSYLVKLADFGMSKDVYTTIYHKDGARDTPKPVKWMAIESIREGRYDFSTEVWSFGVLMWELFSQGGKPYETISNPDIEAHLLKGNRLCRPEAMPEFLYTAISRCWLAVSKERPTMIHLHEFMDALLQPQIDNRNQTDNSNNEELYIRKFTKDIPHDYTTLSDYVDGGINAEEIYITRQQRTTEKRVAYQKNKKGFTNLGVISEEIFV